LKLWNKGKEINNFIEDYTVGEDYILDRKLLYYDCVGSIAHARTLERAGILTSEETEQLVKLLSEIKEQGLEIKKEDEDVHTALENHLTKVLGDLGKKIHTGRSRNDQVMVDIQLWVRDEMRDVHRMALTLCETLNDFARENPSVLPGYTHMQRAMPSSIELLMGSYIESLLDDLLFLETAYKINNRNPLGSAAGYGSTLNLDREYTAKVLGFEGNKNYIYVQSRTKLISSLLFPLCSFMKTLDKISSDLLLFTMGEFKFFSLPDEFCTGSSIMPQKKNYDVLELVRAKSSIVHTMLYSVDMIGSKLISGYNRDYQMTKKPLMEAFDITVNSLNIMVLIFENLRADREMINNSITRELFATDRAYELVKSGTPFRESYGMVAKSLDELTVPDDIYDKREFLTFKDYKNLIEERRKSFNYE